MHSFSATRHAEKLFHVVDERIEEFACLANFSLSPFTLLLIAANRVAWRSS